MLHRRLLAVVAIIGALAVPQAGASVVVLEDLNSEAHFDPASQGGMVNWIVDGRDHMFQQWFWYRVGDSGGEISVDRLAAPLYIVSNANFNAGDDHLIIRYAGAWLQVDLTFDLVGGSAGSGKSNIGEQIKLTNTGGADLDLHFFQYCDFDLDEVAMDDRAVIVGGNRALQDGNTYSASEAVLTSYPDHYQVAYYPEIINALNDAQPTTLTDYAGRLGPGNVTWAFQWDVTLAPGDSFQISKTKALSPDLYPIPVAEPTTGALILLGGGALLRRRRRRHRHAD